MKRTLTDLERNGLDQRVAEAEKRTGAQVVLAVVKRSDTYAELPWKAFALGAARRRSEQTPSRRAGAPRRLP